MKTFLFSCLLVLGRFAAAAQDPIEVPGTQQSLVTKLTATWCPFCGGSAWDSYKNMVASHSANAVVFAAHTSTVSKLYSPMAVQLLNNFDLVYSQPYFFYNTKVVGTGGSSTENTVTTNVNNAAKNTPIVQTGMKLTFDDNSRELTVQSRSQFFQYTTGEYFLAFYLLEKAIVKEQASRSASEIHSNVFRTSLLPEVFGKPLASGTILSGTFHGSLFTYGLPSDLDVNNLIVASVIWKKNGTKYDFVNANWTDVIGKTVTSVQDPVLLQGFRVWPNVVADAAQVRIALPSPMQQVRLDVFDMNGKKVTTLFEGRLPAGTHPFELSRRQFPAAGKYTLRLMAGNRIASQPVMVF
ncbi:MAG: hypothetical protein KIPDCIKN_03439 [Haliscomenobacter sp.]|jgi:hypothetical protein|nr:hypothetical protein [Haliscomenobacter sp.]